MLYVHQRPSQEQEKDALRAASASAEPVLPHLITAWQCFSKSYYPEEAQYLIQFHRQLNTTAIDAHSPIPLPNVVPIEHPPEQATLNPNSRRLVILYSSEQQSKQPQQSIR